MNDPIRNMIAKRNQGIMSGMPSFCTANPLVIEAVLEQAKRFDDIVLIEATANQVNQLGGYTGMTPIDFKEFVYEIADHVAFPREQIILGGDHLGPLIWADESENEAMEKSIELVRLFVLAGYKKIHLDTSMRLASDPKEEALSNETIAKRGAILYQACEEAYQELLNECPDEVRPTYIIGSEVPIPGGAQEVEDEIVITKPESVEKTIAAYQRAFQEKGLCDAFENIVGIVVQPGVEFGDSDIFHYNSGKAHKLCECMKKYGGLVLEGHSTDYQSPKSLRAMVEDGIAILKVGPALTFALREALFSLSKIEQELIPEEKRANFIQTLERIMIQEPENWKKHYRGTKEELVIKRKYSFSDRCRYYFAQPEVETCIKTLFNNLDEVKIPINMLQQYMPIQYIKVRDRRLKLRAKELAKDSVTVLVEDYNYAVKHNYIIGGMYV